MGMLCSRGGSGNGCHSDSHSVSGSHKHPVEGKSHAEGLPVSWDRSTCLGCKASAWGLTGGGEAVTLCCWAGIYVLIWSTVSVDPLGPHSVCLVALMTFPKTFFKSEKKMKPLVLPHSHSLCNFSPSLSFPSLLSLSSPLSSLSPKRNDVADYY